MSTSRIEAFSDSIFAVILTLLVLEIRVPQVDGSDVSHELAHRVLSMTPKFLAYGLSFVIVCIWWVAHHQLFRVLARSDRGLLWINCLFLLWLSFIPFPTAMIGDFPREAFAVMSYGAVMTLAGLSFCLMRYYTFFGADLVDQRIEKPPLKLAMLYRSTAQNEPIRDGNASRAATPVGRQHGESRRKLGSHSFRLA